MFRKPLSLLILLAALPSVQAAAEMYQLRPLSGPRADVAAMILGGREGGALRVTGLAMPDCVSPPPETGKSPAESEANTGNVSLTLEIEVRSLLNAVASSDGSNVPESVRVEIYVYAMTRAGKIVGNLSKWVRLSLIDLTEKLPGGGVKLMDRLELPPGEYQLRVLVRDARSQQYALRALGVTVPSSEDTGPSLTWPLFHDDTDAWLLASGDGTSPVRELVAALPVLVPGKPRPFAVQGCHLGDASLGARLLTRDGQPVDGARIRFKPPEETGVRQIVSAEIELEETDPGLYLLEVVATSRTGESNNGESVQSLPVFVATANEPTTWTALGSLTAEPETPSADLDLEGKSGSSQRVRAIASGYREALDLLASGRLDLAAVALERLELEVLEAHDNPRKAMKWLTEAENRVTGQLLGHDPECLLPLLTLHLELQSRYVATDDMSTHLLDATRTRIRSLAQVYATDAKQEMASALAAMSLAELARVLERSGRLISALIVLREALALDRGNTDVILDLAYQYEHHGFRSEALDLLRRLVDLDPRSDEGRLRLAMSLFHIERSDDAVALLRQLISNGSSEWVLAVAYQELGHYLLRRERFEDAAGLLEKGVSRLPKVQRLRIQLAYALDRSGHRRRGREVVAGLPPDQGRPSPRLLYRIPDRGESQRSRAELLRHGTARLPLLATALAESGAAE